MQHSDTRNAALVLTLDADAAEAALQLLHGAGFRAERVAEG